MSAYDRDELTTPKNSPFDKILFIAMILILLYIPLGVMLDAVKNKESVSEWRSSPLVRMCNDRAELRRLPDGKIYYKRRRGSPTPIAPDIKPEQFC